MSNQYRLHPPSNPEQSRDDEGKNDQLLPSQISLKINKQLMNLMENDDNELEIEFTSLTEGKIFCGGQEFIVTFTENQSTEIYRRRESTSSGSSSSSSRTRNDFDYSSEDTGVKNDFDYVGVAEKRYTVKSSYEVVSQDIRQKSKVEQETKEQHRSHFMSNIHTSRTAQTVDVGLPSNSNSNSSSAISGKKRSGATLPDTHFASSPNRKAATKTINSSSHHDIDCEPRWIVIRDLPKSTTSNDIRSFLSGLKVFDIFASKGTIAGDGKDVYVQFEKQAGADMGIVRHGETISIAAERKRASQNLRQRTANTMCHDDTDGKFSTHIYRIHHAEASWAKALCMRLDDTAVKCQETWSILNDHLPSNLLKQHPRQALLRWENVLKGYVLPSPDEIVSYDEHHRLRDHSSMIYRNDYTSVGGFYDPYVEQSWGCGYVNQLCNASSSSFPCANTEELQRNVLGNNTSNSTDSLHGNVMLHGDYEEIVTILDKLNSILSTSLLLPFTAGDDSGKQRKIQCIVCDHVHRMIGIYQRVHHILWIRRFAYSQKLI